VGNEQVRRQQANTGTSLSSFTMTENPPAQQDCCESQQLKLERKRTPLPKMQLAAVCWIQLAEPITATVIYPFIPQFIADTGITGGDEKKTGYYAGIIVNLLHHGARHPNSSTLGICVLLG
jgi:hypothetical protein